MSEVLNAAWTIALWMD